MYSVVAILGNSLLAYIYRLVRCPGAVEFHWYAFLGDSCAQLGALVVNIAGQWAVTVRCSTSGMEATGPDLDKKTVTIC